MGAGHRLNKQEDRKMWIFYAVGSSFFAGITAILAKCGIKKTDSDVATGASWLCYFHALQRGDVNKVVPIDKSSTILFSWGVFHEKLSKKSAWGLVCIVAGTLLLAMM